LISPIPLTRLPGPGARRRAYRRNQQPNSSPGSSARSGTELITFRLPPDVVKRAASRVRTISVAATTAAAANCAGRFPFASIGGICAGRSGRRGGRLGPGPGNGERDQQAQAERRQRVAGSVVDSPADGEAGDDEDEQGDDLGEEVRY
jgi:hypothetical protein